MTVVIIVSPGVLASFAQRLPVDCLLNTETRPMCAEHPPHMTRCTQRVRSGSPVRESLEASIFSGPVRHTV